MRNLKRALSLLLSSAMVLGMLVMGSSAASYTDVTSEKNVEAIEVLKAVGVMTGDENGNFNPDKQVTRAEMAVVMANLLDLKVEDFKGASLPFTDVPEWAVPYVAACYADGITAGISATQYGSNNSVTTAQAALMMMKALGYFQYSRDFGSDWQVATVKQGSKISLFDGVEAGASAAMTRNDVAQIALNTLEATMVETDGSSTSITLPGGITIDSGDTKYVNVTKAGATSIDGTETGENNLPTVQLGEKLYDGDLRKVSNTTDAMGRPATAWTYKSNSVGTYADKADYTAYVTSSNNTLAKVVDSISKKFDESGATKALNGATNTLSSLSIGDYVEIYMDADDAEAIEYIAVTHKSVAKLTGDADTKVDGDDTLVKVPGISALASYKASNTTETVKGYAGLVKDDIVLYYADNEGNYYLEKADSFTGTLTAAAGTKYTIDGTKYDQSGATGAMSGITVTNFYKDSANWYVDNGGNVVWVEGTESTELAFVVDSADPQDDWQNTTHKAKLMSMDGTIITVETKDSASTLEGKFVKYSVDSDNVYTLSDAAAYVSGTTEGQVASSNIGQAVISKGNPTVKLDNSTSVLANANTVFMVRDYKADGTPKESYTLYTGYTKVPSMSSLSGGTAAMDAYVGTNGYAKYVVIDPNANISGSTSASDLFYVVDATVTTMYDADGISGYSVKAIKNGDNKVIDLTFSFDPSTSVTANASTPIAVDKAYIVSTYNDDGQITSYSAAVTEAGEYLVGSKTGKANEGTFMLNGKGYAYTDDTVVYFINEDDELTVMDVASLEDDVNNTYVAVRASDNSSDADYNTIKTLFVREVTVDAVAPTFGTDLSSTDTATTGSEKTFTVAVNNNSGYDVTYAWYVNGSKVDGANTATLQYTFANAGSATVYCVVTYSANTSAVDGVLTSSATSTVCTVTVTAP